MPIILLGLAATGLFSAGFFTDKLVTPSVTNDPSQITGTPSPYQLALYASLAMGVYWVYKHTVKA